MPKTVLLSADSPSIQYLCKRDKRLAKVIAMVGEIRYAPHENGYEFLINEIIEQMLSTKASAKIFERLVKLCNGEITPGNIIKLSDDEIKSIGTSKGKVSYIRNLTNAVLSEELILDELVAFPDEEVRRKLMTIKGIGKWTADMYLMFVLDRPDILPVEDVAFLQAYGWLYKDFSRSADQIKNRCKKWKPYSSIAARYLYRALDMGLTKNDFHLYK